MPLQDLSRLKGVKMRLRFRIAFAMLALFHAVDFFLHDQLAKRNAKRRH